MKNLAIVAKGRNTARAMREQLHRLLGNRVNVSSYALDEGMPTALECDAILVTSCELREQLRGCLACDAAVVVARRSINYNEVGELFKIPAETDVLLVNDSPENTYQTIALLQTLGVDHINYHPYAPQLGRCPHLSIAVTPGERELVPEFVERVVDIKVRLVDITTIVEVLLCLGLLEEYAEFLSANYIQDIIRRIKQGERMMRAGEELGAQLKTILGIVHDGIVAMNGDGVVTVFNRVAAELLQLDAARVVGRKADEIGDDGFRCIVRAGERQRDCLVRLGGRQVVVNAAALQAGVQGGGTVYTFKDVSEIRRLEETVRRKLQQEQKIARYTFAQIEGGSPAIREAIEIARKMAASAATILIQGESGTGKELIAQGIHNASPRKDGPFVAVNFAALTETLLESELFGYAEGAFTGASRGGAAGLFEEAHKGTIFLDEIGDAPLQFQVKLLRVLQEQQIRRVGSAKVVPIDVRVIAATNRDLKKLIAEGKFRQDLYYRIHVLPIRVPPLKERGEDTLLLAQHFYCSDPRRDASFSPAAYFSRVAPYFLRYDWPGNVRELQNAVAYLLHVSPDAPPALRQLPEDIRVAVSASAGVSGELFLRQAICREIAAANRAGTPIGRRSLAEKLHVPENRVREALEALRAEGRVTLRRGRAGIKICVPPAAEEEQDAFLPK